MELTATQVEQIVNDAMTSAAEAARRALAANGDRDCCGFAWVNVWDFQGKKTFAQTFFTESNSVRRPYRPKQVNGTSEMQKIDKIIDSKKQSRK